MIDSGVLPLFYFCSGAGLLMVISGVWLLCRQKIYIDRESKEITEIETPLGKFRTNIPALALFALGFVPLIYPTVRTGGVPGARQIKLRGEVTGVPSGGAQVYAAARNEALTHDRKFVMELPIRAGGGSYSILYSAGSLVLAEAFVDIGNLKGDEITLGAVNLAGATIDKYRGSISDVPPEFGR